MSNRNIIWLAVAIFTTIYTILFFLLPLKDRTLINVVGLAGFLFSVMGILIAYLQIISIKKIALETQRQIADNIQQYNRILMISDLSKKGEIIHEIQDYLRDDKIDLCRLRMKDLKAILANIGTQREYSSLVSKKVYIGVLENFQLDYLNFLTHNLSARNKIDKSLVIEHLENLSLLFLNVENQLKNPKNDTGKA